MASDYEVIVLYDGFSTLNEAGTEMLANCSCSLIKGPKNIIVDTMTAWDGPKILNALNNQNIATRDIDWVICTHCHSDHVGNNALFLNATHIVGKSISNGEKYLIHDFNKPFIIDDNIKVISTPGHTMSCVSVIVNTKNEGTVAIVGDLFEKEEDIENEKLWLEIAGSECPEKQRKNRKYILENANFIVPGHGPMFAVTEKMKCL